MLNPLSPIFEPGREWMIDPVAPGAVEAANGDWWLLVVPALLFVAICALGVWTFAREAPASTENI